MSLVPFNHTIFHIATHVPDPPNRDEDEFPHPLYHRPVAVSLLRITREKDSLDPIVQVMTKGITDIEKDEGTLVEQFFQKMPGGSGFVVSYMGRPFALPVMVYAALRHGVDASDYLKDERAFTARYSHNHIDLADFLSGYGAVPQNATLSDYARIIGFAKRVWVDVPKAFEAGDIKLIKERLEIDVMIIAAIYIRLLFSQGRLEPEAFELVAKKVLHAYFDRSALAKNYLKKSNVKAYLKVRKRVGKDADKKKSK